MAYHVELSIAAKTDTGLVRPHNEDAITHNQDCGLVILADGMGGYNAGEVASAMAIAILKESIEPKLQSQSWVARSNINKYIQQLLVSTIEVANSAIFDAARQEPQYSGMGTTVVAAVFHQNKLTVAHVGDSRLYRIRHGELLQLTRDHSYLQEQIDAGLITPELARFSPHRNLITRAVGVDHTVNVEVHSHVTEVGDIYLLCSDGLSDMLSLQEISDVVQQPASTLTLACEELIARTNRYGGRDNTSVILIAVHAIDIVAGSLPKRVLRWLSRRIRPVQKAGAEGNQSGK